MNKVLNSWVSVCVSYISRHEAKKNCSFWQAPTCNKWHIVKEHGLKEVCTRLYKERLGRFLIWCFCERKRIIKSDGIYEMNRNWGSFTGSSSANSISYHIILTWDHKWQYLFRPQIIRTWKHDTKSDPPKLPWRISNLTKLQAGLCLVWHKSHEWPVENAKCKWWNRSQLRWRRFLYKSSWWRNTLWSVFSFYWRPTSTPSANWCKSVKEATIVRNEVWH